MVLYPTGITGEMLQMLAGAASLSAGTAHGFHFDLAACLSAVPFLDTLAASAPGAVIVLSTAFSYRLVSFTWIGYLAGGPYMWLNMYAMRKRAYRNRSRAQNKRPPCGVEWPVTDKKTGARSSLRTNKVRLTAPEAETRASCAVPRRCFIVCFVGFRLVV